MENKLVVVQSPDVTGIVAESSLLVEQANGLIVDSKESYAGALEGYRVLKLTAKKIKEHYEPTRSALESAKKELLRARNTLMSPIEDAMKIVSGKAASYEIEEERKEKEAARIAEAAERKRIEEEMLARASEAEEAGNEKLAESIISQPVNVVIEKQEPAITAVKGVSTRDKYSAKVVDMMALLKHVIETGNTDLVMPNMVTINARARAQREHLAIPGVQVVVEKVRSVRG